MGWGDMCVVRGFYGSEALIYDIEAPTGTKGTVIDRNCVTNIEEWGA